MKIINAAAKILTAVNNVWEWVVTKLLILMTVLMVASVFLQVATRAIHYTVIWTSDVATFLFVWLAFLGAAVAVRENDHFVVDIFPAKWKTRRSFQIALHLLALLAQLAIGFVMLRYGLVFTKSMSLRLSYSIGLKLSYIVSVVPISGFLILLGTLERFLNLGKISMESEEKENVE